MKSTNLCRPLGLILFFCVFTVQMRAQTINVQGVVKDASGEPIIGATVIELGTSNGTVTDIEGNFTLKVPSKSTISISYIGYMTQELPVNGRTVLNVVLKEDSKTLDEVVVVGYGQMKRSDLTGSVVSVSDDAIKKSVVTSVDQVLQGRAAGVQVQANSGMPGASSSIRIRGINSLNASNEPIFVIDGVIIDGSTSSNTDNPLSSINPSDILSIDVLKDASATAIYGARAANGVIIITTKRGNKGEAKITYNGYVGWQEMPKQLELLNLQQYAELKNAKAEMGILEYDNNFVRPDLLGEGTNWQNELFQKALMSNQNVSITGGSEKINYAINGGYLHQAGIAIGSGFQRLNFHTTLDAQVKKYLKVGVDIDFNTSKQKLTVSDESLISVALKQTPNVAVRNADGSYDGPDTDQYVQSNPVGLAMLIDNHNEKMGTRGNTYLEATIIKGLTFRSELSFNYGITNTYKFTPSYTFGALENTVREGSASKSYSKYWGWRNILTYTNTFADKHNVNVMVGQEMSKSHWEYLYGYRTGYLTNGATDLNAGDATTAKNSGSSGGSAIMSQFGRAFYSFDNKYLATFTLRHDGSSNFYNDNRWGWFPSAALAWKMSNESFLKEKPNLTNLKLRLGWGQVGNQNVSSYAYTSTYSSVATNWGTGLLASNTANRDLTWETTDSYNLGLDLSLYKNRIELIADVYYKRTRNLLLQLPLPAYVGTNSDLQGSTSAPWANVGSLQNKGFELTLNTVNYDKKGFQWRSSFIFSLNRNKVLSLDTQSSIINKTISSGSDITTITRTAVGQPIGQFYGYKVIGRFEKATDFYYQDGDGNVKEVALPEDMSIGENGVWIGDYMFKDVNNDGVINEEDRTYIGNPEPDFTYGIGNTFNYKNFDLSVYLTGSYGNDVVNYNRRFLEDARNNTNLLVTATQYAYLGYINPDLTGDQLDDFRNIEIISGGPYMPRLASSSASDASNFRFSDKFIEDGSYLRIQSVSFGYNLPTNLIHKIALESVRVYCNLQNLYTFTKYTGYDPELGSIGQDALMTGIDNFRYPSPRIYTFGVNVSF